ncbi:MAG: two-component sensor histidine kinase, partial [Alphaproteobacteria bacterium]|nr:two-component sensor histidine kinase [Alphaproteobacteria bacterium]
MSTAKKMAGEAVGFELTSEAVLNVFPHPILVLGPDDAVGFVNPGAEQFFATGAAQLCRSTLADLVPFGSPVIELVREARENEAVISEYGVDLGTPRLGQRL